MIRKQVNEGLRRAGRETLGVPMFNGTQAHPTRHECVDCYTCNTPCCGWDEDAEAETATECGTCGRDSYDPLNK
jgi:hypothetical protein